MKPLLITLCTAVSALAGWHLGSTRHTPHEGIAAGAIAEGGALRSTIESDPAAVRHSMDVKATVDRLIAETAKYGGEKFDQLAARIYPAFQDLPSEEFEAAMATLDASSHHDMADLLAGMWAERDLPAAREWALRQPPKDIASGASLADTVFRSWAGHDRPGMLSWLEAQVAAGNSPTTQAIVQRMACTAATSDPERGFRLIAASLPDKSSAAYQQATYQLYAYWAQAAPEAATARALAEPSDTDRAGAVGTIAFLWRDRDAAVEWARKLPDPLLANSTLSSIAGNMALDDPEKGFPLLASLPQTERTRQNMRNSMFRWAWLDFHAALGWMADFDDAALAPSLMAEIAKRRGAGEIETAIAALPPEQKTRAEQWWQQSRAPASPAKPRP